jgi:hypothetical protein
MNTPDPQGTSLLQRVLDLATLRSGPQELPHSANLLLVLFVVGTAVDVASGVLFATPDALGRSLLSNVIVLGLCWIALAIRSLRNRYLQTATALVACGLLFSLLQLPIAALIGPTPTTPAELAPLQILLYWILFALFVWQLAVSAHIMRHAMDASFAFALVLVASWVIVDVALGRALFGV